MLIEQKALKKWEVQMSKGIIAFILFLVFNFIVLVFVVDYGSSADNDSYERELTSLKDENKQLKSINATIDLELTVLDQSNDSLRSALKVENEITAQIKIERDEKMDDINGMDNNELYGFFSNFKTDRANGRNGH